MRKSKGKRVFEFMAPLPAPLSMVLQAPFMAKLEELRLVVEELLAIYSNGILQNYGKDSQVLLYMLDSILCFHSHLKFIMDEAVLTPEHMPSTEYNYESKGANHV